MACAGTVSVDLLGESHKHLAFIDDVIQDPTLFNEAHVTEALSRYERCWLPLVRDNPGVALEPPLDVHWVWYLHLQKPTLYRSDCTKLIGIVPPHVFYHNHPKQSDISDRTRQIWDTTFPGDPFERLTNRPCGRKVAFGHVLQNLAKQREFLYQISLRHYRDQHFLASAFNRYKQFLATKKTDVEFVACACDVGYDVEFMMRTHMTYPDMFLSDMKHVSGKCFNAGTHFQPSPLVLSPTNSATEPALIFDRDQRSLRLPCPGTLFRGESAEGKLARMTSFDKYRLAHKGCSLLVKRVELELTDADFKGGTVVLGVASWSTFDIARCELQTKGKAPYVWTSQDEDSLVTLDWKTEGYEQLYMSLYRKGTRSRKRSKAVAGVLIDKQLFEHLEQTDLTESQMKTFGRSVPWHKGAIRFAVTAELQNIERLSVEVSICPGPFEVGNLPEDRQEVWGPVRLHNPSSQTASNLCSFALHRLLNHRSEEVLSVRVIHSRRLRMSLVEVVHRDRVVVVSHLVGHEQLPTPQQVAMGDSFTLDMASGERAMLVKNADGDWGLVKGVWIPGKDATDLRDGTFRVTFHELKTAQCTSFPVPIVEYQSRSGQTMELLGCEVDWNQGRIRLPASVDDIPEHIALLLSIGILYILCAPKPLPDPLPEKRAGIQGCSCLCFYIGEYAGPPADLLLGALGCHDNLPTNAWLQARRRSEGGDTDEHSEAGTTQSVASRPNVVMYRWGRHQQRPGRGSSATVPPAHPNRV